VVYVVWGCFELGEGVSGSQKPLFLFYIKKKKKKYIYNIEPYFVVLSKILAERSIYGLF
jgi:hypothetical protein